MFSISKNSIRSHTSKLLNRLILPELQAFTILDLHTVPKIDDNIKATPRNDKKLFKNISIVKPKHLTSFLYNDFKLKFVETAENEGDKAGIELLRNIASNHDYWIVMNNQSLLLYYRIQLMLQRISFLKPVGLTPIQKLRQIQKYPPALLFSFTDCTYDANMVYLRGMTPNKDNKFVHWFHPVTCKITLSKSDIQQRLASIQEHLEIKEPTVLRELLNMPCFFMEPSVLNDIPHHFIHKHSMPFKYDIDQHSVGMFPPITNLPKLDISREKYFSNKVNDRMIAELPSYQINDVLDYSYPKDNGKGALECMSSFLVKAEIEEEKDRTGGQPLKGRRGFNMPARQY